MLRKLLPKSRCLSIESYEDPSRPSESPRAHVAAVMCCPRFGGCDSCSGVSCTPDGLIGLNTYDAWHMWAAVGRDRFRPCPLTSPPISTWQGLEVPLHPDAAVHGGASEIPAAAKARREAAPDAAPCMQWRCSVGSVPVHCVAHACV